jgi:hypothetical protein
VARKPPWTTNYIPGQIRAGLSAEEAWRQWRDEFGYRINKSTFLTSFGQTVAALANRPRIAETPEHRRPDSEDIIPYSARNASGYLYSFEFVVRLRSSGEVLVIPSGYRTDRLVRMGTALSGALDAILLADPENSPDLADMQVLSSVATEVREYVPE